MDIIINIIITAISAYFLGEVFSGIEIENLSQAILFSIALGLLNSFIKPVLEFISLPIKFLTLGLFQFVINALTVLWASSFVDGIHIDSFLWALIFSISLSFVSSTIQQIVK